MAKRSLRTRANEIPGSPGVEQANDQIRDNRSMSMGSEPSQEDIRLRAYQRYLERGGAHGGDFDDWIDAEQELRNRK